MIGITFRDLTEKSGELFQQCLDLLLFLYSKADNKADSFLSLLTDLLIGIIYFITFSANMVVE